MFQFTTTNVINSVNDFTTGKPLWTLQEATDDTPASLNVKRVNNFKADSVLAIYKAKAVEAENAKVTLDLSQIGGKDGDQFRISLYVGLTQSSTDSRYSNDLYVKGKPFSVDFVWNKSAADTAKKLVDTIKKYNLMVFGEKLLNVSYSTTFITIEATTEYQRFKKVNIEKFNKDAYHGMGEYTVVRSLEDIATKAEHNAEVTGKAEAYFEGIEGFGTYSFLLHNLRLPTQTRTRAFGTNQDETPIVGAKYNQYTIHYCKKRGIMGMNAVGEVSKSLTTHVFYVLDSLATDFETALSGIAPDNKLIEVPEVAEVTEP